MLTFLIFFPLLGAAASLSLPRDQQDKARLVAALTTLVGFGASIILFLRLDRDFSTLQFTERVTWIKAADVGFSVQYHVAVDGLSVVLILLTGLLFFVAALISWNIAL